MSKKFTEWIKETKLVLSVVKIIIGVFIGVGTVMPVMYGMANELISKTCYIDVKYKIDCVTYDINSEFADDIRPFDLEYVMDKYAILHVKYKNPGMQAKMKNIERYYESLINGGSI